jgi:uncharacterized membrane protein
VIAPDGVVGRVDDAVAIAVGTVTGSRDRLAESVLPLVVVGRVDDVVAVVVAGKLHG